MSSTPGQELREAATAVLQDLDASPRGGEGAVRAGRIARLRTALAEPVEQEAAPSKPPTVDVAGKRAAERRYQERRDRENLKALQRILKATPKPKR